MSGRVAELLLAAAGGAAVAALYLALLWLSVRGVARTGRSGGAVLAGAAVRIALACAGLWLAGGGDGAALLAALAGFVAARSAALAVARSRPAGPREESIP